MLIDFRDHFLNCLLLPHCSLAPSFISCPLLCVLLNISLRWLSFSYIDNCFFVVKYFVGRFADNSFLFFHGLRCSFSFECSSSIQIGTVLSFSVTRFLLVRPLTSYVLSPTLNQGGTASTFRCFFRYRSCWPHCVGPQLKMV